MNVHDQPGVDQAADEFFDGVDPLVHRAALAALAAIESARLSLDASQQAVLALVEVARTPGNATPGAPTDGDRVGDRVGCADDYGIPCPVAHANAQIIDMPDGRHLVCPDCSGGKIRG